MYWEIEFYEFSDGSKPVLDFLRSLPRDVRAKVWKEIDLLEKYGTEISYPKVCKIKGKKYKGLWELRIFFDTNSYRIFYFLFRSNNFIMVHAITKKQNKTKINDLETARRRMLDYIQLKR